MRKKEKFKSCELLAYKEFIDKIHYVICIKHSITTPSGLNHYECLVGNRLSILCELWLDRIL